MEPFVRRSHLLVSVLDSAGVKESWIHNTDAVILDLTSAGDAQAARQALPEAVKTAGLGGAEVFALVNEASAYADIDAAVRPGLSGIVYTGAESAEEVGEIDTQLADLELIRGIAPGSLQIIILLDSGAGVWNIREIVRASPRVSSVGLDEIRLCVELGIVPTVEFDPFEYARGRVVIEARASKVQPIGMTHPFSILPETDDDAEIYRMALKSKNMGFAGAISPGASWVRHCNRAFAPPEDRLEFFRETRRLFAEGVARGTAAVPYPGTTMMIDVPVDENARVNLELWALCEAREAEKAAAVARAESS